MSILSGGSVLGPLSVTNTGQPSPLAAIYAEIRAALDADLLYLAVVVSASIPDVCANLELVEGQAGHKGYRQWYRDYVGDALGAFDAEECYELRCGVLHRAATRGSKTGYSVYDRFAFVRRESNIIIQQSVVVGPPGNRILCVDARIFCETIIASAEKWERALVNNSTVQANMERVIRRRSNGLPPLLGNVALIA